MASLVIVFAMVCRGQSPKREVKEVKIMAEARRTVILRGFLLIHTRDVAYHFQFLC